MRERRGSARCGCRSTCVHALPHARGVAVSCPPPERTASCLPESTVKHQLHRALLNGRLNTAPPAEACRHPPPSHTQRGAATARAGWAASRYRTKSTRTRVGWSTCGWVSGSAALGTTSMWPHCAWLAHARQWTAAAPPCAVTSPCLSMCMLIVRVLLPALKPPAPLSTPRRYNSTCAAPAARAW